MVVSEITLFNTLKTKIGEQEAQTVVEGIKQAVREEFENKKDVLATKVDIAEINTNIERLNGQLLLIKWMLGVILGGIVALILKAFFMHIA